MQVDWGWLIFTIVVIVIIVLRVSFKATSVAKRNLKKVDKLIQKLLYRISYVEMLLTIKHNDRLAEYMREMLADLKELRLFQKNLIEFLQKG